MNKGLLKRIGISAGLFLGGFGVCCLISYFTPMGSVLNQTRNNIETSDAEGNLAQSNQDFIRIRYGQIEWFDGRKWNNYDSVANVTSKDPELKSQEKLAAYEEKKRNSVVDSTNEESMEKLSIFNPLIGTTADIVLTTNEKAPLTDKNSTKPSGTQTTGNVGTTGTTSAGSGSVPSTASQPTTQSPSAQTPATEIPSSQPTTTENPGSSSPATETPGAQTPAEDVPSGGDGEDLEWSDDYL